MEIENLPGLLTVREVSLLLRKAEGTIQRGLRTGAIPGVRVGGTYRIPREYVLELHAQAMRPIASAE